MASTITESILELILLSIELGSYLLSIIFIIFLLKKYYEYKQKYEDDDR